MLAVKVACDTDGIFVVHFPVKSKTSRIHRRGNTNCRIQDRCHDNDARSVLMSCCSHRKCLGSSQAATD